MNIELEITYNEDELIRYYGKVYILASLRQKVIHANYNLLGAGYGGIGVIYLNISKRYYFLEIRKKIRDYISKYTEYTRNKVLRYVPYGEIVIVKLLEKL